LILIISESNEIIGADEEFLQNSTLDRLKETFPSMDLFVLQSSNKYFTFTYNNVKYNVEKHQVIVNHQKANLFYFIDSSKATATYNTQDSDEFVIDTSPIDITLQINNPYIIELENIQELILQYRLKQDNIVEKSVQVFLAYINECKEEFKNQQLNYFEEILQNSPFEELLEHIKGK